MSRVVMCFLAGMLSIMGATFAETPLDVMSFNIRYGMARDGENAWPHRRALLVETIQKLNPDVVGLQECLRFQIQYIVKRLPEYRWIGIGRDADGSGEMTAILCRYDSLMPLQSGTFLAFRTSRYPRFGFMGFQSYPHGLMGAILPPRNPAALLFFQHAL